MSEVVITKNGPVVVESPEHKAKLLAEAIEAAKKAEPKPKNKPGTWQRVKGWFGK